MTILFPQLRRVFAFSSCLVAMVTAARAETITDMTVEADGITYEYVGSQRQGALSSSIGGKVVGDVTGTPKADDVKALFSVDPSEVWTKEGERTSNGTDDLLSVSLTSGSWNGNAIEGTFQIDPSFWSIHSKAVITIHVGNGAGNPDWFFWQITPDATSGIFSYKRTSGGGGGLSNVFLWGAGDPVVHNVPDSANMLGMLGAVLVTLAIVRRRMA